MTTPHIHQDNAGDDLHEPGEITHPTDHFVHSHAGHRLSLRDCPTAAETLEGAPLSCPYTHITWHYCLGWKRPLNNQLIYCHDNFSNFRWPLAVGLAEMGIVPRSNLHVLPPSPVCVMGVRFASKWLILAPKAPNGINPGLFQIRLKKI